MNNLQKRKHLIRKLFKVVAKETVGAENLKKLKLLILTKSNLRASYCQFRYDGSFTIGLNLRGLLIQVKNGYTASYYKNRPDRLNKYIINNRHNALRFVLYHEARHAWQKINKVDMNDRNEVEYNADTWALAHIQTKKTDQIRVKPLKISRKVSIYIHLYKQGYSTSKIALVCKIKDPRSIRYYLTKSGINLRRS